MEKGFTLIELMIVIAILAILVAIANGASSSNEVTLETSSGIRYTESADGMGFKAIPKVVQPTLKQLEQKAVETKYGSTTQY